MRNLASERSDRFLVVAMVAQILLMLSTRPLWLSADGFPAIPFFASLAAVPLVVDQVLSILLLICCAAGVLLSTLKQFEKLKPIVLWIALLTALMLAALNQHRLQPWHWLFILIVGLTIGFAPTERIRLYRLTIASVYLFAGLSRLGVHAADGMSRQIVTLIFQRVGLAHVLRDEHILYAACTAITLAEAITGLLLLLPRTRTVGVVLAISMHGTLLLVLGPLGLNHHSGVQIWNLFFIVGVPLLFFARSAPTESAPSTTEDKRQTGPGFRLGFRVAAFALIAFPASGLFGLADNWPSWQVYSPRPEVVHVFVRNSAISSLPKNVRDFTGPPIPLQDWSPLRIDQWSLQAVNAPLYPQVRFALALAGYVSKSLGDDDVKVTISQPQLTFWRPHESEELPDRSAIIARQPPTWRLENAK